MTSAATYEYLSAWLSEAMESGFKATRKVTYKTQSLIGLGKTGKGESAWINQSI